MKGRKTVMLIRFFYSKQHHNVIIKHRLQIIQFTTTHIYIFCIFLTKNEMEKWNLGKKLLCYIIYIFSLLYFSSIENNQNDFFIVDFYSFFLALAIELIFFIFHISEYIKETL